MNRSRRWSVTASVVLVSAVLLPVRCESVPAAAAQDKADEKWLVDRSLTVTPQPEPVPAFGYRLFPLASERKDGNAVPIYLRLRHEQRDEAVRQWSEGPAKWNDQPLDKLPVGEAKEFLKGYRRMLQQIELGARRKTAEWNYTFDQGSVIDILLPDAQTMRSYVPLLILQMRVELAEGDYAAAARTAETGFAFSRHVAEGPFIINGLVGVAMAQQFLDRLPEWVERPGSPNLYWPLTALPRPLIAMRKGMEFEQRLMGMEFPDLADLDRPRTAEQWGAVLMNIRTKARRFEEPQGRTPPAGTAPTDPADQSPDLPAAKRYLTQHRGMPAERVAAMPPAQVLVLTIVEYTKDFRDEQFKAAYLPYPQARSVIAAVEARLKADPDTEAKRFAQLLIPAIPKVMAAQDRLERKVAALRVIEALRLHAAAHSGQLPGRLDQVTAVPVPNDPGTGKPFEYSRDGATATLISRIPGEPLERTGLRYRVTVRPK
jgi:hypothetical protein